MTGLRSLNRYHAFPWQEGAPYPGELDYLASRSRAVNFVTPVATGRQQPADNYGHGQADQQGRRDRI